MTRLDQFRKLCVAMSGASLGQKKQHAAALRGFWRSVTGDPGVHEPWVEVRGSYVCLCADFETCRREVGCNIDMGDVYQELTHDNGLADEFPINDDNRLERAMKSLVRIDR